MAKPTPVDRSSKPKKPRADFPLYPHASGKWGKTIKGRTFYFGTWDDPEGALREYLDAKDDLYAGRVPEGKRGVDVRELCNRYMKARRVDVDADRLSPSTFICYDNVCRLLVKELGGRVVSVLGPADFAKLYGTMVKNSALSTLGRNITIVRIIFKWAFDSDAIKLPVKFGPAFKVPTRSETRRAAAKAEHENGTRVFTAEQIRTIIDAAQQPLKTMILLGINCGFGNMDCSSLPLSALDLNGAWLNYPRPKTGVARRVPLWPETVNALREAIPMRPDPTDPADAGLVFLTHFGQRWVREGFLEVKRFGKTRIKSQHENALWRGFHRLLEELGLWKPRVGFYRLRHTFETVAGGCRDQVAVDAIMGHVDASMAATYRHGIEDDRLRDVVNHVRAWLWPAESKPDGKGGQQDE